MHYAIPFAAVAALCVSFVMALVLAAAAAALFAGELAVARAERGSEGSSS